MDRRYLEILSLCQEAARKILGGRQMSQRQDSHGEGNNFSADLEGISERVEKLIADGKNRYPLIDIIKQYKLDIIERTLLYYYYGARDLDPNPGLPELLLKFLGNNNPVDILDIKLRYFGPHSKLVVKEILASERGRTFELSPHIFRQINCQLPMKKRKRISIPSVKEIHDRLSEKVIGQEEAKRILTLAVHKHYISKGKIRKSNIMLIGPTGCGKTFLVKTLAEILEVPVVFASANEFTCSGYVGKSIGSVMVDLLRISGYDRKKAERGIIFLDEIDKISAKVPVGHYSDRDVAGRSVQEELLNLLESNGEKEFTTGDMFERRAVLNAGNVLFIAAGAFSGLADIASRDKRKAIGFTPYEEEDDGYNIRTRDLERYGLIPELLGRFTNIVNLSPLTCEDLICIMKSAKDNPVNNYMEYFADRNTKLVFTDDALKEIAFVALEQGHGARGLRSAVDTVLAPFIYQMETDMNRPREIIVDKSIVQKKYACHSRLS